MRQNFRHTLCKTTYPIDAIPLQLARYINNDMCIVIDAEHVSHII